MFLFGSHYFPRALAQRWAFRRSDVPGVIAWAEAAARKESQVALALSYEAAPALDPTLKTRAANFPLAWAAVLPAPAERVPPGKVAYRCTDWKPSFAPPAYRRSVERIRALIARGDIYQANFTFPLRAQWSGDPWSWFLDLTALQRTDLGAYLDWGRWKILSLSPELFFSLQDSRVTVRPMKGSRARGGMPDAAARAQLRRDPKERAENLMIVDLLRSDLGKICRTGSVRTQSLFDVETYSTVHQMTSTVTGQLRSEISLAGTLAALFPSGSVTGAPKIRAMEVLSRLEPTPRGVYTGAIGYHSPKAGWTFNVAIRTLTVDRKTGRALFPVGSGITWSSRPDAEYEECLMKADFLRASGFSLLETMRLENGRWLLVNGHRDRMECSARAWQFPWNSSGWQKILNGVARWNPRGVFRVRVTLSRSGLFASDAKPLEEKPIPLQVRLAAAPVAESVFLHHKTTARHIYDAHRRPGADDTLLWNRRGELTEFTTGNLVMKINGRWWTPPVESGLLPGIFRRALLASGNLTERVLRPRDLKLADGLYLINSVRRWLSAVYIR